MEQDANVLKETDNNINLYKGSDDTDIDFQPDTENSGSDEENGGKFTVLL